jgi:hypothetical protein
MVLKTSHFRNVGDIRTVQSTFFQIGLTTESTWATISRPIGLMQSLRRTTETEASTCARERLTTGVGVLAIAFVDAHGGIEIRGDVARDENGVY